MFANPTIFETNGTVNGGSALQEITPFKYGYYTPWGALAVILLVDSIREVLSTSRAVIFLTLLSDS